MDIGSQRRDNAPAAAHPLTPEQAAELLGCHPRTVRRHIASGALDGRVSPYSTTAEAVAAFRVRQQSLEGDVVAGTDKTSTLVDTASPTGSLLATIAVELATELQSARDQVERLARENGRLQAELAHAHAALLPAPADAENSAADRPRRRGLARLLWWRPAT